MRHLIISFGLGIYARFDESLSAGEVLDLFDYANRFCVPTISPAGSPRIYKKLPVISSEEDIDKLLS